MNISRPVFLLALSALLAACNSSEADWKKADSQNTTTAFQSFLSQHPNDSHAPQAQARLQALADDQAWADAQKSGTPDGFQQYLAKYPNGLHAADAQTQVATLNRIAAWKVAQAANTMPALQDFLQKYTEGPEVDQARAQLEKLKADSYRVQLATFHSQKDAEKSLPALQSRTGTELHNLIIVPPSGAEKLHRIESDFMTQDEAKLACDKLKKAHQRCEVVKG